MCLSCRDLAASGDRGSSVTVPTTSSTYYAATSLEHINSWTVHDVIDFISVVPGCSRYAEVNHQFVLFLLPYHHHYYYYYI